jgi:hypothetical protein
MALPKGCMPARLDMNAILPCTTCTAHRAWWHCVTSDASTQKLTSEGEKQDMLCVS